MFNPVSVSSLNEGDIFQTVYYISGGKWIGTGNYYKAGELQWWNKTSLKCRKRFTGEVIMVHRENFAELITDPIDGF